MKQLAFGTEAVDWQERINFPRLRQERLAKARAVMKKNGLAACLLCRADNVRYTTGVKGLAFMPQLRYALVFAEHDPIVYELGEILEHNRVHCPWIKPENWRFSHIWLGGVVGQKAAATEAKKWAQTIKTDLEARGLAKEPLGIDVVDDFGRQALQEAGIKTVSAMPALMEAKRTKTQDEINCLRMAIAIANTAYYSACQNLKPGVREKDVGAEAQKVLMQAGAEVPRAGVIGGPNGFEISHIENTDRLLQLGDLAYVYTCSTSYMGYQVCYYRTFCIGRRPNDQQRDWYRRCYERVYSVIEAIKPGATTADAAKHYLPASAWGYQAEQQLLLAEIGHGIGLSGYEQPVIQRAVSLENPQTFEPGMVIAVESREGEPFTGGVRLEEMVLVTDNGHEIMTDWPSQEIVSTNVIV